jgi:hypothetical protein
LIADGHSVRAFWAGDSPRGVIVAKSSL